MNYIKIIPNLLTVLILLGCDRKDYVTWKCHSQETDKATLTMIIDGSNLKILQQSYKFCGSLGLDSYFDRACPATPQQSQLRFNQKTGNLNFDETPYACKAL